ncbi:NB-ARC domain-containing protein [[Actinomadura] parvosata]|uniref:NB-ARC domain-containing protein n=1 Tax=[Actinomadura] parvosata TaxID=1955412 RepID=UPI001645CA57|nr:NB-ARC domain-containing protein [Nonomuraea sp. ATCC 55076]
MDFDLIHSSGRVLLAAQVKSAKTGRTINASDALVILLKLIKGCEADRYELITAAAPDDRCIRLAELLSAQGLPPETRAKKIRSLFRKSFKFTSILSQLAAQHYDRLLRARIVFDHRSLEDIRDILRNRIKDIRASNHIRVGEKSTGLILGYLIAEILRRAADADASEWVLSDFRRELSVSDDDLIRSLGGQELGVIYGPVPPVPEVERSALLAEIAENFTIRNDKLQKPQYCILTGLSGIGKSSLASSYLADSADRYDVIFWIDASSGEAMYAAYRKIIDVLSRGHVTDDGSSNAIRDRACDLLRQIPGTWLIVYDDADLQVVRDWLPKTGNGHVLVTSTDTGGWRPVGSVLRIDSMTTSEALLLTRKRLDIQESEWPETKEALLDLIEAFERWPLAVELACAYILSCNIAVRDISSYLSHVRTQSLDDEISIPIGYPRTLVSAIRMGIHRIQEVLSDDVILRNNAMGLLCVASYFSPSQIPVQLIATSALIPIDDKSGKEVGSVLVDEAQTKLREIIRAFTRVSFVRYSKSLSDSIDGATDSSKLTVNMNAILQEVLRDYFENGIQIEHVIVQACYHTERWLTAAVETGRSELSWEVAQHAASLVGHAKRLNVRSNRVAHLMGNVGGFYYSFGRHEAARHLLETEIAWLDGVSESSELLGAQARLVLASIIRAEDSHQTEAIAAHIEQVLQYVRVISHGDVHAVRAAIFIATQVQVFLEALASDAPGDVNVSRLLKSCRSIVRRLPKTPASRLLVGMQEANDLIAHGKVERAKKLIESLLSKGVSMMSQEIELRRLLIECLSHQHKWGATLTELSELWPILGANTLYRHTTELIMHNVGLHAAVASLMLDDEEAADVLLELAEKMNLSELMHTTSPQRAIRFALLSVVISAKRMDLESLEAALASADFTQINAANPSDSAWLKLLDVVHNWLVRNAVEADTKHQRASNFFERPTFSIDVNSIPTHSTKQWNADPEFLRRYEETNVASLYLLTSDPAFSRVGLLSSGRSNPLDTKAPLTYPVAIFEPRYFLGITLPNTGASIEAQIEGICQAGLLRLSPAAPAIRLIDGWKLTWSQPTGGLELLDGEGGKWAVSDTLPPAHWKRLARERGRVVVLYGFGFNLHAAEPSAKVMTSNEFADALISGMSRGLIAIGSIEFAQSRFSDAILHPLRKWKT